MSKNNIGIIYELLDRPPEIIDNRLFNALNILISEDDINYLNNKSYEDEDEDNTTL